MSANDTETCAPTCARSEVWRAGPKTESGYRGWFCAGNCLGEEAAAARASAVVQRSKHRDVLGRQSSRGGRSNLVGGLRQGPIAAKVALAVGRLAERIHDRGELVAVRKA